MTTEVKFLYPAVRQSVLLDETVERGTGDAQQLAGLAIAMSNLRRRVGALLPHDEQLARDVSSLQARVIDVAESVRQVSRDLHPGLIKHSGLVAALSAHCDFSHGLALVERARIRA